MCAVSLDEAPDGALGVRAIEAPPEEQLRLSDLGLHVGCRLRVVQRSGAGLLVSINEDARLTLGLDTARRVKVRLLEPAMPALTLSDLVPGDRARILGLGHGAAGYRQRLMSMGLTPGVEFAITRVAPLGDPVEISLRGFAMSLRKAEAALLSVEKLQ
ncbi:ferrous iron transport protein A [Paracoccus ferrooxidans]|nr:ferrous iron transport protein A [Paracoccus ferrooxidans]